MWWKFPVEVSKIDPFSLDKVQLYLSGSTQYTYKKSWNKKTDFYSYLKFKDAEYEDSWTKKTIPETYKVISVVEWKKAGGWKIEIPFILANWKRL
jgi:hypothetical protein